MTEMDVMAANGSPTMPDFDKTTDQDEEAELVDVGVKINSQLKDELQEHVREANDGRIRGVYRNYVEDLFVLGSYLHEQGIKPHQAIERLEVYQSLMPIEGELKKLSDRLEDADEIESELAEVSGQLETLNQNLEAINDRFERQNTKLDRIDHELSRALYSSDDSNSQ